MKRNNGIFCTIYLPVPISFLYIPPNIYPKCFNYVFSKELQKLIIERVVNNIYGESVSVYKNKISSESLEIEYLFQINAKDSIFMRNIKIIGYTNKTIFIWGCHEFDNGTHTEAGIILGNTNTITNDTENNITEWFGKLKNASSTRDSYKKVDFSSDLKCYKYNIKTYKNARMDHLYMSYLMSNHIALNESK